MKLFEYAVIYNPYPEETKKGVQSKLLVPVRTLLASTKENATIMAAREIPEDYLSKLDRIEVAVRPF